MVKKLMALPLVALAALVGCQSEDSGAGGSAKAPAAPAEVAPPDATVADAAAVDAADTAAESPETTNSEAGEAVTFVSLKVPNMT